MELHWKRSEPRRKALRGIILFAFEAVIERSAFSFLQSDI
jgi:hypothetical protein